MFAVCTVFAFGNKFDLIWYVTEAEHLCSLAAIKREHCDWEIVQTGSLRCAGNSSVIDLCDLDNDQVGCQQLCVLVPGGRRQCACAVGFRLADDQRSCLSGRCRRRPSLVCNHVHLTRSVFYTCVLRQKKLQQFIHRRLLFHRWFATI